MEQRRRKLWETFGPPRRENDLNWQRIHVIQPVRQFAASGWPPRGEELVGSPTEQLGLGAQRLVEQDLGRLFATPLTDTTDPAAAPEAFRTGRVLHDPSSVTLSLTTTPAPCSRSDLVSQMSARPC